MGRRVFPGRDFFRFNFGFPGSFPGKGISPGWKIASREVFPGRAKLQVQKSLPGKILVIFSVFLYS